MTEPIKKKFVTDANGNKTAVILDMKTYSQLIDEIDDLNCALGYDQAKKETSKDFKNGNVISLDDLIAKTRKQKSKRTSRV